MSKIQINYKLNNNFKQKMTGISSVERALMKKYKVNDKV